MPIVNNAYQSPGWINDQSPAINATELNAISDTLECVPIANGGTGQTSVTSVDLSTSACYLVLRKWGKIVMCEYKALSPTLEEIAGIIPASYRPSLACYTVAPVFNSSSSEGIAVPKGWVSVFIGANSGTIHLALGTSTGYPRFAMTWLTN